MEALKGMEDNQYDLAIVDPLYGVQENAYRPNDKSKPFTGSTKMAYTKNYHQAIWNQKKTPPEYFKEILRKSKNQIIWGGNYFIDSLYSTRCMIVWDKDNSGDFADCELAWTSFDKVVKIFKWRWNGMLQQDMKNKQIRIHPTEKPIQLYKWLLKNYAKPGDKILDTHGGSMSIALACHDMKFSLDLYEIDKDYFQAGSKRYNNHIKQLQLF